MWSERDAAASRDTGIVLFLFKKSATPAGRRDATGYRAVRIRVIREFTVRRGCLTRHACIPRPRCLNSRDVCRDSRASPCLFHLQVCLENPQIDILAWVFLDVENE